MDSINLNNWSSSDRVSRSCWSAYVWLSSILMIAEVIWWAWRMLVTWLSLMNASFFPKHPISSRYGESTVSAHSWKVFELPCFSIWSKNALQSNAGVLLFSGGLVLEKAKFLPLSQGSLYLPPFDGDGWVVWFLGNELIQILISCMRGKVHSEEQTTVTL